MTGNYEYSRGNRENVPLPIQIEWSEKPLTSGVILLKCLESMWNFQCSEKTNEPHRSSISEVIECEICAYLNP